MSNDESYYKRKPKDILVEDIIYHRSERDKLLKDLIVITHERDSLKLTNGYLLAQRRELFEIVKHFTHLAELNK